MFKPLILIHKCVRLSAKILLGFSELDTFQQQEHAFLQGLIDLCIQFIRLSSVVAPSKRLVPLSMLIRGA